MTELSDFIDSTVVDLENNTTTVAGAGSIFYGVVIVTGTIISGGLLIKDGTQTIMTLPASATVGSSVVLQKGIICKTSLIVDPADAQSASTAVILYKV